MFDIDLLKQILVILSLLTIYSVLSRRWNILGYTLPIGFVVGLALMVQLAKGV